ncbi:MAG TPA: hypothetical protein VHM31_17740 [Polyangia bacterium]|nr:hypothetical protein [Polyangia bacterium]
MTFWVVNWLRAFGLTVLIELAVALPLLAAAEPSLGRRVGAVIAANLATHPLVWFLFPGLALGRWTQFGLSEAWAVLAEIAVYRLVWPAMRPARAGLVSLLANAASCLIGLLLMR